MSSNAGPVPRMADHTSPTIREPAGILIVDVTMYVPWSKKMIFSPACYAKRRAMRDDQEVKEKSYLVQDPLYYFRVICFSVSLCPERSYTDKLIYGEVFVLRMSPAKDTSFIVQKGLSLSWWRLVVLNKLSPRALATVHISADPVLDCCCPSLEDHRPISDADSSRDILEFDVVENDRTG